MFGHRFFANAYFAPQYFGDGGTAPPPSVGAAALSYARLMSVEPRKQHASLNVLPFSFNSGAVRFGSVSDVLSLCKIPNGALITDIDLQIGASGAVATSYNLVLLAIDSSGTASAITTLIGSVTSNASTAQAYARRVPYALSLSSDRAAQYAVLALNCIVGASGTVSTSLQGSIKFLTDGSRLD